MSEYYNFWEYAKKFYGLEFSAFEEGEGTKAEWDLVIEILYQLRKNGEIEE